MTQPADAPPCDVCQEEPAYVSVMMLATWENMRIGLSCIPEFFRKIAADVAAAVPAPEPPPHEVVVVDGTGQVVGHVDDAANVVYDPQPASAAVSRGTELDPLGIGAEAAMAAASGYQREILAGMGIADPPATSCPQCAATAFALPGSSQFMCPYCHHRFLSPPPPDNGPGAAAAGGPAAAAGSPDAMGAPF